MISINLTIHNKQNILQLVLEGIFKNCILPFEFIAVLDGCTDNSEEILTNFLVANAPKNLTGFNVLKADNVFETKANNMAARVSSGKYICIIQDDQIIDEYGFDARLIKPFEAFPDVFAVSGNCAHNWTLNVSSTGRDAYGWCDILNHIHHANKNSIPRDVFAVRDSCNRGPLVINAEDFKALGYFDENAIDKQDCDDHLLMYDAKKKLNKVVGYYGVEWYSRSEWGGTRDENGQPKQWHLDCQAANVKTLFERHKDVIHTHTIDNRFLE